MIPVSETWKAASMQQFRYPGYLRATIKYSPPGLKQGMEVTSPDTFDYSRIETLNEDAPIKQRHFVSLEPNRWLLDGTFEIVDPLLGPQTTDWWSQTPVENSAKEIVFELDTAYNIPGLQIAWDVVSKTYPTRVQLIGYDTLGAIIKSVTITDINSERSFLEYPMDGVKKIILKINEWKPNNWRARIAEIVFGISELYTSYDRVVSADVIDSADSLNLTLPKSSFNMVLSNMDEHFDPLKEKGVSKYILEKQLVQYEWGFEVSPGVIEWTPKLDYFLSKFKAVDATFQISAQSRIAFLGQVYKPDVYTGDSRNLKTLAESVLQQSGILTSREPEEPWELDSSLQLYETTAPIAGLPVNVILQHIAGVAGLTLLSSPVSGFVKMVAPSDAPVHKIEQLQIHDNATITSTAQLKYVYVNVYTYTKATEKKEVAKGKYQLSGVSTIELTYSKYAVEVSPTITGATIQKATYYSKYASITVQAPSSLTNVEIQLNGFEVTKDVSSIETFQNTNIANGLAVTLDNPFVTSVEDAKRLSKLVEKRYAIVQDFDFAYSGYPELSGGDTIELDAGYGKMVVPVRTNKVTYNGGWNGNISISKEDGR